jgi:hypothetical protein
MILTTLLVLIALINGGIALRYKTIAGRHKRLSDYYDGEYRKYIEAYFAGRRVFFNMRAHLLNFSTNKTTPKVRRLLNEVLKLEFPPKRENRVCRRFSLFQIP